MKNNPKINYIKMKKSNLKSLDQFVDKHYGKKGTRKRDQLDSGFED